MSVTPSGLPPQPSPDAEPGPVASEAAPAQHTDSRLAGAQPASAELTDGGVAAVQNRWITEDWIATVTGLALLLLLISGILPTGWVL